jgi:hypothetical protein
LLLPRGVRAGLVVTMVAALAGGCGGEADTSAGGDALAGAARALALSELPGRATVARPLVARSGGGWVLPWQDAQGVHVRVLADDGAGAADRFVAAGRLIGAVGLGGGFAVAVADAGGARLFRFVDAVDAPVIEQRVPTAVLDGDLAPALASDGSHLLLLTIRGGELAPETPRPLFASLVLVAADGSSGRAALGQVASLPSLSGDARGFIVAAGSAAWLVAGDGSVRPAPGSQIAAARLFRRAITPGTSVASDEIARDGGRWLSVPGLVGWASGDGDRGDGATLELVAGRTRFVAEVGDDLTWSGARPLPSTSAADAAVCAADSRRVILAAPAAADLVFAVLDRSDLRSASPPARLPGASTRATSWQLGPTGALAVWNGPEGVVHYAFISP